MTTSVETLPDVRFSKPTIALGMTGQIIKLLMVFGFMAHHAHGVWKKSKKQANGSQTFSRRVFAGVVLYYSESRGRIVVRRCRLTSG